MIRQLLPCGETQFFSVNCITTRSHQTYHLQHTNSNSTEFCMTIMPITFHEHSIDVRRHEAYLNTRTLPHQIVTQPYITPTELDPLPLRITPHTNSSSVYTQSIPTTHKRSLGRPPNTLAPNLHMEPYKKSPPHSAHRSGAGLSGSYSHLGNHLGATNLHDVIICSRDPHTVHALKRVRHNKHTARAMMASETERLKRT
jgi:hypothetical protein